MDLGGTIFWVARNSTVCYKKEKLVFANWISSKQLDSLKKKRKMAGAAVKKNKGERGATAKPKEKTKKKKPADHPPPTSEMVLDAVRTLKDRHGSSLQAIKKYIGENYDFELTKHHALFIRKAITKLVDSGSLSQVKGQGAGGSFKLGSGKKPAEKQAPKSSPKKTAPATQKPKTSPKEKVTAPPKPKTSVKVKVPKTKTVAKSPPPKARGERRKAAPKKT